ncbi:SLA class II histocompatibility antigen, DQ haplotype D alpha chain-like [Trichomycterus rosablanca]|uniref:SLA class II histocompatibility antigen, DQ haplotype D alpha chain-like n=1 Tax=Trichomycterus rosablanca TaxID=2290929 RepID=UPI002F35DB41
MQVGRYRGLYTFGLLNGCSERISDFSIKYGEETIAYFDYKTSTPNVTLPDFVGFPQFPDVPKKAEQIDNFCKQVLAELKEAYKDLAEHLEPPTTSIYPKKEIRLKESNTLVCHVMAFFPPPVSVLWSKNGTNVTHLAMLSPHYRNPDGTLGLFSSLSFIPKEGDSYSCTVEHPALNKQDTKTWDVDVDVDQQSVYPSVVCYVGLVLGLLGVAVGVFFIVKARQLIN